MEKKPGYIGKIENAGTQYVQAPNQKKPNGSKGTVIRGKDLRAGKK